VTNPAPTEPVLPTIFEAWSFAHGSDEGILSFSADDHSVEESIPTWHMDLPAGSESSTLDAAEESLARSEFELDSIPERLDTLLVAARTGAVSFDTPFSPAEAELFDLLDRSHLSPEMTSFDLFSSQRDKLQDAGQTFQNAILKLSQMVSHMAFVETNVEGRLVGRTRVRWSGDFASLFPSAIAAEELTLHQRSLNLALASRRLAVSMIARTAQGAAKIAAYLAAPGGILLALPVVWKYINSVLSEIKTYQEISIEGVDHHGKRTQ